MRFIGFLLPLAALVQGVQLHTYSRWIVDATGARVKLACVNWAGTDQKDFVVGGLRHVTLDSISSQIASWGFNCVRLPWSVEVALSNPRITDEAVLEANPSLLGLRALDILDIVLRSLESYKVMVILDNHMSEGDWCCSNDDHNGLWYNDNYPVEAWTEAHLLMARRYRDYEFVVGCELRNELRVSNVHGIAVTPTWGDKNPASDWWLAATKMGNQVLEVVPHWLIVVDGLDYSNDLTGVASHPVVLNIPNQLVYSAHNYPSDDSTWEDLHSKLGKRFGYIIAQGQAYTAPLWISEFGDFNDGRNYDRPNSWWNNFMKFLTIGGDFDFAYWRLDGSESHGTGRVFDDAEPYGIFNQYWNGTAGDGRLLKYLQALIKPTEGPGISEPLAPRRPTDIASAPLPNSPVVALS